MGCLFALVLPGLMFAAPKAQDQAPATTKTEEAKIEPFDPLIPQQFAFDKKHQLFCAVNNVSNAIDILRYEDGEVKLINRYNIDVFQKRHDVDFIYRPQSVAIYGDHIVVLASNRDSCFLSVLDIEGTEVSKYKFGGKATAFSYDPGAKELYIAGQNTLGGYDIIALSTADGISKIIFEDAASFHYQRPKKSEEIAEKDPWGAGMAAVAMSVVFLGLLILYLVFKQIGSTLLGMQVKRAKTAAERASATSGSPVVKVATPDQVSGEEFAAIAATIYMYTNELHDEENTVLTINKVMKNYSPWSSKIYGLNNSLHKR